LRFDPAETQSGGLRPKLPRIAACSTVQKWADYQCANVRIFKGFMRLVEASPNEG